MEPVHVEPKTLLSEMDIKIGNLYLIASLVDMED